MPSKKSLSKYRTALKINFPELPIQSLEYLSEGWDSVALLLNKELIFRFPKRLEVEQALLREIAVLPSLAPTLPLPIPSFSYISTIPTRACPFTFVGYEMIRGEQLEDSEPEVQQADWWKEPVAAFLTALHAFPVELARQLGIGEMVLEEAAPTNWRDTLFNFYQRFREAAYPLLTTPQQAEVTRRFEDFLGDAQNFNFNSVLIHGDFSFEHILLDPQKRKVTGIIDFGDCAIGDPALDVLDELKPFYHGTIDPSWEKRRRFYRVIPPLTTLVFAQKHADLALTEWSLAMLAAEWFTRQNQSTD